jgi:hypothetical protein
MADDRSKRPRSPAQVFKPWIVRRPEGGCQVLFPLTELDRLLEEVVEYARQQITNGADPVAEANRCLRFHCRQRLLEAPLPRRGYCQECRALFTIRREGRRFCSPTCANTYWRRLKRKQQKKLESGGKA